ncbi:MAG: hypothetical protein KF819_06945 [Labilithrix sp.]|nr:hypothetical protein [Labilithrix sp.]
MKRLALALVLCVAASCGSDPAPPGGAPEEEGGAPPSGEGGALDAGGDAASACPRKPREADRPRKVVISHPFKAAGTKGTAFEVLDLSAAGALTKANVTFDMGTANQTPIVFTPDGAVGLVAQDDGSVGAFVLDDAGVKVVHAAFTGDFYAHAIVVDATGTRAFVLDAQTDDNGGGVYELAIGCDGALTSKGRVIPGGTAHAMTLLPGDPTKALLSAGKAFASPAGDDAHLVDLGALSLVASGKAYGSGNAIVSSVAVMPNGKHALVADDSAVAGSRVAVVTLPAIAPVQTLTTEYPAAVVASPFGNAALVLNDDSTDELTVLSYDERNTAAPFAIKGRVAYQFPKPQIPIAAAMIERGALQGRVLISENLAVRQVQFTPQGDVTDVEKFSVGAGIPNIVGVVGVQP